MAIGRHDHGRLRPSHPFTFGQAVQHAQLGGYSIVGPGFELEDVREILRTGDPVENARGGVSAGDQAAGISPAGFCNQRLDRLAQFQPPRRESSSRRTW
jgi:hypothetical protein